MKINFIKIIQYYGSIVKCNTKRWNLLYLKKKKKIYFTLDDVIHGE